ncbi:hypothetical protein [Algicola sagamiensis]|uniref:hypothetical protein n=1 Tax=Algicola sagamiensis TaxID=163869 RepID=UPI00036760B8|nr:hypothetical protein [Algicola sagamiensis]
MHRLFVLVFGLTLFWTHSLFALTLQQYIHGQWICESTEHFGDNNKLTVKLTSYERYDVYQNRFYLYLIESIQAHQILPLSKLEVRGEGTFKIESGLQKIKLESVQVGVTYDTVQFYKEDYLKQLEQRLLNMDHPLKTVSINAYRWVSIDPKNQEKEICYRPKKHQRKQ